MFALLMSGNKIALFQFQKLNSETKPEYKNQNGPIKRPWRNKSDLLFLHDKNIVPTYDRSKIFYYHLGKFYEIRPYRYQSPSYKHHS